MSWLDAIRRLLGISGSDRDSPKSRQPQPSGQAKQETASTSPQGLDRQVSKKRTQHSLYTGDMTQFPSTSSMSPKLSLTIGLDFGTAFTKVVIGEARTCYAVPFEIKNPGNPYLLPCVLYIDHSGMCALQPLGEGDEAITDLKMKLLNGPEERLDLVRIVAFIALILRQTRLWLFETKGSTYERSQLDWYINVGVPTDSYHQEDLVKTYHDIVMAAWAVSIIPGPISTHLADEIFSYVLNGKYVFPGDFAGPRDRLIHEEAFGLFPEFVAQIVGYVRSTLRKPDLHLMVDVGAGTVDISIFNIYESDGEDLFPIFAKAVKPFGTHYLIKNRNLRLQDGEKYKWSVQDRTPSQTEFSQTVRIPLKQLMVIDNDFIKQLGSVVRDLLKYTKESRYPLSPRWQDGIPTFLCGGGANVDVYCELIKRFENRNQAYKVRVEKLPQPQRLIAPQLPENSYNRLSVAYGLSHNAMDIGRIIQANEIEDDHLLHSGSDLILRRFISKDDV